MKIIATAALAAATLILTTAVPASADGDHGNRQVNQTKVNEKSSPGTAAAPETNIPMRINVDESAEPDFQQGILPRIVGQLL
ncbi:hypothetical protein QQM39_25750 [Streptomyces sp. DT2A-34]|uniref:hypothetical protein n=1 Tax=Streptomyces sp. DT2A-34 TaxID=3051182 RepID=UPI00265C608B|nr:hypothetical protein [Streptomyces sp. DT2A-34]MDO0914111.1 hypothetical protein [Streptomyces sp. DT2A-34]